MWCSCFWYWDSCYNLQDCEYNSIHPFSHSDALPIPFHPTSHPTSYPPSAHLPPPSPITRHSSFYIASHLPFLLALHISFLTPFCLIHVPMPAIPHPNSCSLLFLLCPISPLITSCIPTPILCPSLLLPTQMAHVICHTSHCCSQTPSAIPSVTLFPSHLQH